MPKPPAVSNVEVCGKSLADQALSENSARPAVTLTAASPASTTTFSLGQVADDVGEEARRDDDLAVALDLGGERRLDGELHVGGEQLEPSVRRLEEDPRQHRKRAARGHATREDRKFVDER